MAQRLPSRASLEWLRKTAKRNLRKLRADRPESTLADAQRELAREYGFSSWRRLVGYLKAVHAAGPAPEEDAAGFLRAVAEGSLETVGAALKARPELANALGPHPHWGGRPQPLHVAIEAKRRDVFELLLGYGADVNGRNEHYDGWSPLMLASSPDRADMRRMLIERGARIGLAEALLLKDDARVDQLLGAGLPDTAPNDGSILAFARTPFAIDRLLELGASAEKKDHWGETPLDVMSRCGPEAPELVRHMMLRGAVPAPEHFARLGDAEGLRILAQADPSTARRDRVILAAVESGNLDLVRWLLENGASANARSDDESRHNPLHAAAWAGDLEMAKLLVSAGGDVNARDAQYDSLPWGWARTSLEITGNAKCAEVADWLAGLMREDA